MDKKYGNPGALILLLLLGGYSIKMGFDGWHKAKRMQSWPSVTGTVESAKVAQRIGDSGKDRGRVYYYPEILYRYTVKGKEYQGNSFPYVLKTSSADAESTVKEFPPGTGVEVFYDPLKPEVSNLRRDAVQVQIVLFLVGGLLIVVGVVNFLDGSS